MSSKLKVLICEDNSMAQKVLEFTLKKMGHEVISASNGKEGIDLLREEDVQLVITDINMPYNSGLELIQFLRKQTAKKIPVLIVSNINLEESKKHAAELGADGYITKPFDPQELIDTIESLNIQI